jgi:fucose permease
MASAYTGSTLMPPLFGWLANLSTIALFPFFLSLLLVLMVVMTERLNRLIGSRGSR